jgi:hypothetical protein
MVRSVLYQRITKKNLRQRLLPRHHDLRNQIRMRLPLQDLPRNHLQMDGSQ